MFITAVISLLVITLTIYLLCKHKELRTPVPSLALQQVKEVGTVTTQKEVNTECKILTYIGLVLTIFSLVMVAVLHYRKVKAVQRMHVLICSENHDIHFRCTILCQTTQMNAYCPLGRQVRLFSSLHKKITDYGEEKRKSHENKNANPFTPVRESKSRQKRSRKYRKLDMGCSVPSTVASGC